MADSPKPAARIDHSLPKIEDSPVFNFLNNLSPITTGKSVRISQAYQSIYFASPPSIFSSPHVNIPKDPSCKDKQVMNEDLSVYRKHPEIPKTFVPASVADVPKIHGIELKTVECETIPLCATPSLPSSSTSSINAPEFSSKGSHPSSTNVDTQDPGPGKDSPECDWMNLMIDHTDLWIFNSPENEGCSSEKPAEAIEDLIVTQQRRLCEAQYGANQQNLSRGVPMDYTESCSAAKENEEPNTLSHAGLANSSRAMRRCLNFEDAGGRRQPINPNFLSLLQPHDPTKRLANQSTCIVPGIGLHLNSLAISANDSRSIKIESLSSPVISDENTCKDTNGEVVPFAEEVSSEERNSSSPKKKRKKADEEGGACKRCNCKKSKCLKLYCECFAAGVYCIEPCSCLDCFNKPRHEDTVLATRKQIESRNPLAFAPKVIRNAEPSGVETIATPASARHKRGCNCKKSNCLKKYCECFQGGVGCSVGCRCEGCKNTFGIKDESGGEDEGKVGGEERTPVSGSRAVVPMSDMGSYGCDVYGKAQIIRRKAGEDEEMPAILGYSPSSFLKSSSPNSKRVSPPHPNYGSSPMRNGRKLILQSIPSFPSLAHQ